MKDVYHIDLNADVGEGIGNEVDIMPYLSSCNIACGGHAGDDATMAEVVRLAKMHKVKIGAHPSFPDKGNFGRFEMKISAANLYSSLKEQIRSLQNVMDAEYVQLHHIKPHGALYNLAARDEKTAMVIVEVVKSMSMPVKLYAPYKSVIAEIANKENIEVVFEAFADRNYNPDLSLVSRKENEALLLNEEAVLHHVLKMVKQHKVKTRNGVEVLIKAATFCVHGDTKNAIHILEYLSKEFPKNQIVIQ